MRRRCSTAARSSIGHGSRSPRTTDDELRAVELGETVGHAHAVEQQRVVLRVGVAGVDRDLEELEAASLQPGIFDCFLHEEPRRLRTVVADQPAPGPRLVVVEDRPDAIGVALLDDSPRVGQRRVGAGECDRVPVLGEHREELGAQFTVDRHRAQGTLDVM